jgi:hypothetical protein
MARKTVRRKHRGGMLSSKVQKLRDLAAKNKEKLRAHPIFGKQSTEAEKKKTSDELFNRSNDQLDRHRALFDSLLGKNKGGKRHTRRR